LNSTHDIHKKAQVTLNADSLRLIRRYLASSKVAEEFSLREDLRFALEEFLAESDIRSESSLFTMLHNMVPYITVLNLLILPPAAWYLFRSVFTFRQLFFIILLISFTVSCYFTYARRYQEVLAQRFERIEKNSKQGTCTPKGLLSEAYNVLLSYVMIKGKSECLQSYEDMLIEPIWLVDPLQVIAEVLTSFILTPLSVAGSHFNKFFNDFFINTPIHLALLKGLFLVFLLFYLTGYRIRTILATIEPAVTPLRNYMRLSRHALKHEDRRLEVLPTPQNAIQANTAEESDMIIDEVKSCGNREFLDEDAAIAMEMGGDTSEEECE